METKISHTIRQWFPDFSDGNEEISDYKLLHALAVNFRSKLLTDSDADLQYAAEILKIVNLLYQTGNQYIRNAIENEFLSEIITEESPQSFKKHLNLFPADLRKGYIKTILEN
ncbi:DUF7674 family protein [Sphingobacterium bovistauri]|uniref:DUF7674 domain-containing protein n=1 Tax=Sphingobacterium bovistauri TaxID=2781959 RepID=A0ABS7Z9K7_9SPHI|nr:hypothetical protein [Sphingobacterium bovistauri]MCA5005560.1 hypothetical protein [Sphingobacterium bovistauri]